MSNVWGNPAGSTDDKVAINYKDRKPVHIPKVMTDSGQEYKQPATQESSTVVNISPQGMQQQFEESTQPKFIPETEISSNGIERIVGYKKAD